MIADGRRFPLTSIVEGALIVALFSPLTYSQNPPPGQCVYDPNQNKCVVQGGTYCQAGNGQGTCVLGENACWCILAGYTLTLTPFTPSPVIAGQQTTSMVKITPASGSAGPLGDVRLSLVSCPNLVTCSLNPNPVVSAGGAVTSTLTATVDPSAQAGVVTITVTASDGSQIPSPPTNGPQSATLTIRRPDPVWGFADLHTHPASFIGFGADPTTGENGLIWGKPAHDFSATSTCVPWLGPCTDGLDLQTSGSAANLASDLPACPAGNIPIILSGFTHNNRVGFDPVKLLTDTQIVSALDQTSPGWMHESGGYPTFSPDNAHGWQAALTVDHQLMHIDNIYRAYLGGLRLMFAAATDDELLTGLWNQGFNAGGNKEPSHDPGFNYRSASKQLTYITNLVNANSSWMQIVTTPVDARAAINNNKLAVVLSLEMDSLSLFDITDLVHRFGVSHVIPVHLADNLSFGGTALYSDLFNGLSNFINEAPESPAPDPNVNFALSTQPVQTVQPIAPDTVLGPVTGRVSMAGAVVALSPLYGGIGILGVLSLCEINIFGWSPCPEGAFGYIPLPISLPPGPTQVPGQINSMDLIRCIDPNDLSECGFVALMKMGLLLDVAHMGQKTASTALTLANRFHYPLMDSHTGLRCDAKNPPWSQGPTTGFPEVSCNTEFGPVQSLAPVPNQTMANQALPLPVTSKITNTTKATPFVLRKSKGNWVYFQGSDDALWVVKDDETQYHIGDGQAGKQYTASTPFALADSTGDGAWVYFQRKSDRALMKIRDDGTQLTPINNNTTASTPFAVRKANGEVCVYFRGTDDALWLVKDDGTQYHIGDKQHAGKQYTGSMPYVLPDTTGSGATVYYQRHFDRVLLKIRDDGTGLTRIGKNTTASTPFVLRDTTGTTWVYFQGTDNALWKVLDDPNQRVQVHIGSTTPAGKQYTYSTPFVVADPACGAWIYFQRWPDSGLWTIRDDGYFWTPIGNNTTSASPYVTQDGWVYFRGTDTGFENTSGTLWKVRPGAVGGIAVNERGLPVSHLSIIKELGGVIGLGEVPKTLQDQQIQIGAIANTTSSTPFVLPDPATGPIPGGVCGSTRGAWVFFQGTDNTLWKIRDDGSIQSRINNNTTKSEPFVVRDPTGAAWVYFQGTDNALWKVEDDGSGQYHIGDRKPAKKQYTLSRPFVLPDLDGAGAWIYYQRYPDSALMKIRNDGTGIFQINGNTTASTPFVRRDATGAIWVYFRGTDNALWKVKDDGGNNQTHIGDGMPGGKQYTWSSPVVVPDRNGAPWVYYQRYVNLFRNQELWKIRDDGSQLTAFLDNNGNIDTTASAPFVMPDASGGAWIYFQGADNTLWKMRDDGSLKSQIGGNTTSSSPFVAIVPGAKCDNWVYFHGTDNALWKTCNGSVDPDPVTSWVNDYGKAWSLMGGKGVALGTDADGLSPLIHQDIIPTTYPFKLDLGCPASGCPSQTLDKYLFRQPIPFNFQTDGIANYGMLPDFIQAASQPRVGYRGVSTSPPDLMKALLHSAEDTIAMWELVVAAVPNVQP